MTVPNVPVVLYPVYAYKTTIAAKHITHTHKKELMAHFSEPNKAIVPPAAILEHQSATWP